MKTLPLAAALTLAAWLISSVAQTATLPPLPPLPPLPSASAPTANKPPPRPLSPTELRESASPPGDLRIYLSAQTAFVCSSLAPNGIGKIADGGYQRGRFV